MYRFNEKIGALSLCSLGLVYAIMATFMGHSAQAQAPADLRAVEDGVDIWKGLALLLDNEKNIAIIDVRAAGAYARYQVPHSQSAPDASATQVLTSMGDKSQALIIAEKDEQASRLVAALKKRAPKHEFHFLVGGVQTWYLSLELPIPLFSEQAVPFAYDDALQSIKKWLATGQGVERSDVRKAISTLANAAYQPTALGSKKVKPAAGKKKKIAGGCG
jgi:rhodanese-related sulfurtransferase